MHRQRAGRDAANRLSRYFPEELNDREERLRAEKSETEPEKA